MNAPTTNPRNGLFQKIWTEPRRFFFWLSQGSLFLLVLALAMAAASPGDSAPLAAWLALAAVIGFVLGVPAFLLSLIPPLRPGFAWLVRYKFLAAAVVVTGIALVYAVENWRGRSAWNEFRRELEAKGLSGTMQSLIPPPVPDEQNFFMAPPWEILRFVRSNGVTVWSDTNGTSKSILDAFGPHGSEAPRTGDLFAGRRIELQAWQEFYRGNQNRFVAGQDTFTNYFPVAPSPQTPGADILLALSRNAVALQQLHEAARRPQARFWVNYDDGFAALLPHLAKMKGCAQYLRLHSAALLAENKPDAALDDIRLALRMNDAVRSEPFLITHLVRLAMVQIDMLSVWDGLADHRWSDAQLAALDQVLARTDFLADFQHAMDGERACSTWAMEVFQRTRDANFFVDATPPSAEDFPTQVQQAVGRILLGLIPTGWFDQNKTALARLNVEFLRATVTGDGELVSPARTRQAIAAIESECSQRTPYNWFAGMLLPAVGKAVKKFAFGQSAVNLARVAVALERHRLAHGRYPESLDALAPTFVAKLPPDVITGQPLKYRRGADGSFVLYSVGWNETDDGGTVVMGKGKTPTIDQDQGDWVWRYPAKAD